MTAFIDRYGNEVNVGDTVYHLDIENFYEVFPCEQRGWYLHRNVSKSEAMSAYPSLKDCTFLIEKVDSDTFLVTD